MDASKMRVFIRWYRGRPGSSRRSRALSYAKGSAMMEADKSSGAYGTLVQLIAIVEP